MLNRTPFKTTIKRDVFPRTAFDVTISKLGGQTRVKLSDCHDAILFLSQRSQEPTVDGDRTACNVSARRRHEQCNEVSNIGSASNAPQRDLSG